jgi:predicted thioesterase
MLRAFPAVCLAEQIDCLLKYLQAGIATLGATVAVGHYVAVDVSHHGGASLSVMLTGKRGKLKAMELGGVMAETSQA